jgi:hypothetical protein
MNDDLARMWEEQSVVVHALQSEFQLSMKRFQCSDYKNGQMCVPEFLVNNGGLCLIVEWLFNSRSTHLQIACPSMCAFVRD